METKPPTCKHCHKHKHLNDYFATYRKSNTLLPHENGYWSKALRVSASYQRQHIAPTSNYGCFYDPKHGSFPLSELTSRVTATVVSPQLGTTYVCLLLAGNHSPLPITLPSAVSELFGGISSVSFRISTTTKHVKCLIEHVLRIVSGVRMHNLRAGPNNKTFFETYIHIH